MKIAFTLILLLHALIHILGFLKAFGFAELKEFKEPIAKGYGLLWLLAMFSIAGFVWSFYQDLAWLPYVGWGSLLLSQTLVFIFWKDAKAGTVGNLLILYLLLWG
jgi:hypothetical protein